MMAAFDDDDFEQLAPKPKRPGPSLKARAIAFLSRREHSRFELARKLSPHVDPNNPDQLNKLLDELEAGNWLSNTRFAQSLVHRRDRKSTRLNSSHVKISYAVFCLK